jgi:uncharacterized beta-barrel protein YwiB (DUF1934 family)
MTPDQSFPARIRIESTADDERSEQTVTGIVYRKSGTWYLRYEERDDDGMTTRTFVKLADGEWVVTRHGPVSAELRFAEGRESRGHYRIGGMELDLSIRLESSEMRMEDRRGMVRMAYGLSVGGQPERRHTVTYWIESAQEG